MAKSKKTDAPVVRCEVEVRHDFTTSEWKEKTNELTMRMKEVELKEEAVKAAQATSKSIIKQLKSDVNDLANQLRNGYAMVTVHATVEFNKKKGVKKLFYHAPGKPENKKLIREEAMVQSDYELLPLDDVKLETQPPLENAAAELQDSLQRRQVAEDGEPVRVRSEDEKE